jgi:hypothetical protein
MPGPLAAQVATWACYLHRGAVAVAVFIAPRPLAPRIGLHRVRWVLGKEGSLPGYESITMYSPFRETTIQVVPTKEPGPITPSPMVQALAMYGPDIGFGLTPAQALAPTHTAGP